MESRFIFRPFLRGAHGGRIRLARWSLKLAHSLIRIALLKDRVHPWLVARALSCIGW